MVQFSVDKYIYEVKHNNAHAWVEAFIEPVGWVLFEPTPAYSLPNRMDTYKVEVDDDGSTTSLGIGDNYTVEEGIPDKLEFLDDSNLDFFNLNLNKPNLSPKSSNTTRPILLVVLVLTMILPVRYLIALYRYRTIESNIVHLAKNKRVVYRYKEIVVLLSLMGYPQNSGETHFEYAQRVGYKFYDISKDTTKGFKEITNIFMRAKYGGLVFDGDIELLEEYKLDLEDRLKNKMGKSKYFYHKYFKWI